MIDFGFKQPRLPSHYYIAFDPPGSDGEESLTFWSERRTLKLRGQRLRELYQYVLPLLDGRHTIDAIIAATAEVFSPHELAHALQMLAEQQIIQDAAHDTLDPELRIRLEPQLNYLHELGAAPEQVQRQLLAARVAVIGLGGAGAHAVLALAAAHVGTLRLVDHLAISPTDGCIAPIYAAAAVGEQRAAVLAQQISRLNPTAVVDVYTQPIASDQDALAAALGCDFVICCVDLGQSETLYRLNRACLEAGVPWTAGVVSAFEGVIGPTVLPSKTPCYLCATMRTVAATADFEQAFRLARLLSKRKQDDSSKRENTAWACGIVGNLLALETTRMLAGPLPAIALGQVVVVDMTRFSTEAHTVLRRPDCPACGTQSHHVPGETGSMTSATIQNDQAWHDDARLRRLVSPRTGLIQNLSRVARPAEEPEPPLVYRAMLANVQFQHADLRMRLATGVGETDGEGMWAACGEAIERYCALQYDSTHLQQASFAEVQGRALPPTAFVLYSEYQYRQLDFPYQRFDENARLSWIVGRRLPADDELLVPAALVLLRQPANDSGSLCPATSNGLSVGTSHAQAVLHGLLELIERDAFLITWMHRLQVPRVDVTSVSGIVEHICRHYQKQGLELLIFNLATDLGAYVMLACLVDRSGQGAAAMIGLGCSLDPVAAVRKALFEICQIRPSMVKRFSEPTARRLQRFEDVRTLDDHSALFAQPEMLAELDFLLTTPQIQRLADLADASRGSPDADCSYLLDRLAAVGSEVVSIDLTTPDVRSEGLVAVRVLASKLQPLHFGYGHERLGGQRLYGAPAQLGYTARTEEDLNRCPHPLA